MMKQRRKIAGLLLTTLILALFVVKFDLLATSSNIYKQVERFFEVVKIIDKLYFEEVDSQELVDEAINGMLEDLDPHSTYIPKDRVEAIAEQFEGEFEGIGIEFLIHNKIPTVVSAITGSPSERLGLRPGDQIVEIAGVSTYGISDQGVRDKLLGRKGTQVTVTLKRPGLDQPFEVTITRDRIPIYSINASFMFDDKTGYIRVGRFAKTTHEEFETALHNLEAKGMKRLILDLRGNSGGLLNQAVEMADNFLEGGKRIVYTRGRIPDSNEDYYSTDETEYAQYPLIILINHGSASAAEIVAGAIQDWDRGLILGVTSFGKGLVQQQVTLRDGAAVRVTIARYYTPSGRLIQRSYENGLPDYYADGRDDIDPNAEIDTTESRPFFTTSAGRKVYGGGGISPDFVLKSKSIAMTSVRLIQNQLFFELGSQYATAHRSLADNFSSFRDTFQIKDDLVKQLLKLAGDMEIEIDEKEIDQDVSFIKRRIKSQIARNLWGSEEFYQIEVLEDEQVQEAVKYFSEVEKITQLEYPK